MILLIHLHVSISITEASRQLTRGLFRCFVGVIAVYCAERTRQNDAIFLDVSTTANSEVRGCKIVYLLLITGEWNNEVSQVLSFFN